MRVAQRSLEIENIKICVKGSKLSENVTFDVVLDVVSKSLMQARIIMVEPFLRLIQPDKPLRRCTRN